MSTTIKFFAAGIPAPGGSKVGFVNPKTGRVVVKEDCKRNASWRSIVAHSALQAYRGPPLTGPVNMQIHFVMPRPKSHYRSGRYASWRRAEAPFFHEKAPDTTKLIRSTEDALKGIAWKDDSQVAIQTAFKTYGVCPGAHVTITPARVEDLPFGIV